MDIHKYITESLSFHSAKEVKLPPATDDFKKEVLSEHNKHRKEYGAKALVWDDTIYSAAWRWAHRCKFAKSR